MDIFAPSKPADEVRKAPSNLRQKPIHTLLKEQTAILAHSAAAQWRQLAAAQLLAFSYVKAEILRSRKAFVIGCFTVFIVVFFVSVLQNSLSKSPMIFFKLNENSVGENDLVITPGLSVSGDRITENTLLGIGLVNETHLHTNLANAELAEGSTPRWIAVNTVTNPIDVTRSATTVLLALNSTREEIIKLGREWKFGFLGDNGCVITDTVLKQIGMDPLNSVGKTLTITYDFVQIASLLGALDLPNGLETDADYESLAKQLFPGLTDVWSNNITVTSGNVADLVVLAINFTNANSNASLTLNVTALENALQNVLSGFNLTLNTTALNLPSQLTFNSTANLTQFVNDLIVNLTGTATFQTTVGDAVLTVIRPVVANAVLQNTVVIQGVVGSPLGKWPSSLGNVFAIESTQFFSVLRTALNNVLDAATNINGDVTITLAGGATVTINIRDLLNNAGAAPGTVTTVQDQLDTIASNAKALRNNTLISGLLTDGRESEFAIQGIVQYKKRLTAYVKQQDDLDKEFADFTDEVALAVGLEWPNTFATPLRLAMSQTIFIRYFLDNIFNCVIAIIVALGVMLIFSLLLNDVEGKTYEYGMLRALGMKQNTLIQILGTKSLSFSIAGIATGLLFAFLINIPVAKIIADFAILPLDVTFTPLAVLLPFTLGLVMPIVANIIPVQRALSRTLRDSLDVYHMVISDVYVRVKRLQDLGVDLWITCISLLMIVVGFVTYYLIPYAFQFRDFALFLAILNAILLGMLVGLCILALGVQPYLEKAVLWCFLWGKQRRLWNIIRKNLSGHRSRNIKTAQMFTLCIAFVVFAGTMFKLQQLSIQDNIKLFFGADLVVVGPDQDNALSVSDFNTFLDDQIARNRAGDPNAVVEAYTYISFELALLDGIGQTYISNLPRSPVYRTNLFAVAENFLEAANTDFVVITDKNSRASYPSMRGVSDVVKVMYTDGGNARLPEEQSGLRVPVPVRSGSRQELRYDGSFGTAKTNASSNSTSPATQSERGVSRGVSLQQRAGSPRYTKVSGEAFRIQATSSTDGADNIFDQDDEQARLKEAYEEYIEVIVSAAYRDAASLNTLTPVDLNIQTRNPKTDSSTDKHYLGKIRAMVSKFPGFFYSSYSQTAGFQSTLIRLDQYLMLVKKAYEEAGILEQAPTSVPIQRCLIRVRDDATANQREDVINGLRPFFKSDKTTSLNTQSSIESSDQAINLLNLLFIIVSIVAMVLCFLILWLSFTANVKANGWEFGVLRSLGLDGVSSVLVYVYEALTIVVASLISGTSIGIAIACTLTIQFNLFVEMPFRFNFPYDLFFSLMGMAFLVAVLGSALPAYSYLKKKIATVLRKQ